MSDLFMINKRRCRFLISIGQILFVLFPSLLSARDVEEIVSRSDALTHTTNLSGKITMTITAPNGDQRVTKAVAYQKKRGPEREDRLFLFSYPPNVRNTGLLVHSYMASSDQRDTMWLYLPALDKVKRVDLNSSGHGHFMGSDFTYRDIISRDDKEYVYTLLSDSSDDDDYFVVEVRGKTEELRREFGYLREEHYIRKDDFLLERVVFYDLAGDLLKEMTIRQLYEADGHTYPSRVQMHNHQSGHVSEILFEDISFAEVPDRYFTLRYLKRQ